MLVNLIEVALVVVPVFVLVALFYNTFMEFYGD
jgi:hypothetical protein